MIGTELAMWESYSDVLGSPIPMTEICTKLGHLNRASVLWNCSYITVALQLGVRGEPGGEDNYSQLLKLFFEPRVTSILERRRWMRDAKRFVFHRRQVLLLAKLAVLHCPMNGGIDTSRHPQVLGVFMLAINDHFHFNTIPSDTIFDFTREKLLGICTEMLMAQEFSHGQVPHELVRSYAMCNQIAPTLASHPDYSDINADLEAATGINYEMLEGLTFACVSRFSTGVVKRLVRDPSELPLYFNYFSKASIPIQTLVKYFRLVSGSADELKLEALKSAQVSNDLTLFRVAPFVHVWSDVGTTSMRQRFLILDQGLLFDKISSLPYWTGVKQKGQAFGRFWGAVFEKYVGDILSKACEGTTARYRHSPRLPSDQSREVCDGIIVAGDAVVVLEYKSSIFTAKAKYSGNPEELGKDIRRKLVFDDSRNSPKAVYQLASAAKLLFTDQACPPNDWLDLSSVRRCYFAVITLDSIGSAIGMSPLLDLDFQQQIAGVTLSCETRPLYCLGIESLEIASGAFGKAPLTEIFERWFQANPLLATPLSAIRFEDLITERPGWLVKGWDQLRTRAAHTIFPEQSVENFSASHPSSTEEK